MAIINIHDRDAASAWQAEVQEINSEFNTAMNEAAEALKSVTEFAEGEIVDDFVNFGTTVCGAATAIFQEIDKIADVVADVLGKVGDFLDNARSAITGTIGRVFNPQ